MPRLTSYGKYTLTSATSMVNSSSAICLYYFFCDLVVDSHSRFTILSQLVDVLNEFPLSYNHNTLNQRTFFLLCGGESTITLSHHHLFYKDKKQILIFQIFFVFFFSCVLFFVSINIWPCCHLNFLICYLNCFHNQNYLSSFVKPDESTSGPLSIITSVIISPSTNLDTEQNSISTSTSLTVLKLLYCSSFSNDPH